MIEPSCFLNAEDDKDDEDAIDDEYDNDEDDNDDMYRAHLSEASSL